LKLRSFKYKRITKNLTDGKSIFNKLSKPFILLLETFGDQEALIECNASHGDPFP